MLRQALRLVIAIILASPAFALAETRVALVIGNSAYEHSPALTNPRNDAKDLAAVLQSLGFATTIAIDLDRATMMDTLRAFSARASGADAALFFYAGHGLQVGGVNYLVPIDARLKSSDAVDFELIPLSLVQRNMEREAKTSIIFLDACRDNPLARDLARSMGTRSASIGRGLAPAESGVGTLISFSTQPGNVALDGTARNSPFAGALIRRLPTEGEDISSILIGVRRDVLAATSGRQVPWEHSALTGRFYFKPGGSASAAPPPSSGSTTQAAPPVAPPAPRPTVAPTPPPRPRELARGQAPGLTAVVRQASKSRERISLVLDITATRKAVGLALQEFPLGVAGSLEGNDGTSCAPPLVQGIAKLWQYGNYDAGIEDSQITHLEAGGSMTTVIAFSARDCRGAKSPTSATLSLPLIFVERRAIRNKASLVIPSIPLSEN